ncbi:hypothetical protein [Streptomyces sp. NBC_01187]|uniref:hypothetical protein n=1 Tax=Streptomyces sp. NBC_01187 TaxID=2903766 RepID=UPI00386C3E21|nr:hypothetical protein OG220_00855 [Streptomyces sp. NBC_01187]
MSWDVRVVRVAGDGDGGKGAPDLPLGSAEEVRERVRAAFPGIDDEDPLWWVLNGPTWTIALLMGRDDPVEALLLEVRGSGDDVMEPVFRLAEAFSGAVYDTTMGEFLTGREDTAGWHTFQGFRDGVTASWNERWDVHLVRLPEGADPAEPLADNQPIASFGALADVWRTLRTTIPEADTSDPGCWVLEGPTWTVEMYVGDDDPVAWLPLEVRGSGDEVMEPVFRLARAFGCLVYDPAGDRFLTGCEDLADRHHVQ